MVYGATGAIGSAAVQLLKTLGTKRLLKPGGIYMSTGPGPWYQNLVLPLATPLLGGKKVATSSSPSPRNAGPAIDRFGPLP